MAELVDEVLDLGPILASYTEKRGFPPYDPRLMVRLLIYGYTTGVRSSRAIERKCTDDVAFRYLAADQAPDFRSISRFRRRHLDALAGLFLHSLHLAQKHREQFNTVVGTTTARREALVPGDRTATTRLGYAVVLPRSTGCYGCVPRDSRAAVYSDSRASRWLTMKR